MRISDCSSYVCSSDRPPQDAVDAVSPANYPNLINADYDINDFISTGTERTAFTGAWQPRVGFTYELDDEGRFALFGGYGRSYDGNPFDFLQQVISVGSRAEERSVGTGGVRRGSYRW